MYALILLLDSEGGGQVQQIANTFGVDWPHLIAQIISFSIVCVLLHRFAYKPILRMLELRRQQIAQSLVDSEKIKSELAQAEAKCREIILQANAQAAMLIEEAHKAAARVQQEETRKALAAAEQVIIKSREAAAQEHVRMLEELKREIGQLVVQATANMIGKMLSKEDQRRMAEETLKQLPTVA